MLKLGIDSEAPAQPGDEATQLRARIAAAKLARDAADASAAELRELEALRAEADAAERAARDAEALARLEREHGDVLDPKTLVGAKGKLAGHRSAGGLILLKRPDPGKFKQFQDLETTKREDLASLVYPCRVHPSDAEFDKILEQWPATLTNLADRVAHLAGARKSELTGKS
jgi:hypothetical protein